MKVVPMNKTKIVEFIIDKTLLKLWNISKNMRKRIKMIIAEMDVKLKKYDKRALIFNGWVTGRMIWNANIKQRSDEILKGVFEHQIGTQEELDSFVAVNTKIRCETISFKPKNAIVVDKARSIYIQKDTLDLYSTCSFRRIDYIYFSEISFKQIEIFLERVNSVNRLVISCDNDSTLDLSTLKANEITFSNINFKKEVKLPPKLNQLTILNCEDANFEGCKKIVKFEFHSNQEVTNKSLKFIRGIKIFEFVIMAEQIQFSPEILPPMVRVLNPMGKIRWKSVSSDKIRKCLPYVIKIKSQVPINLAQALNLREIYLDQDSNSVDSNFTGKKGIFTFRPRKIVVTKENLPQLTNFKELFQKVEQLEVHTYKFDLDCLPGNIKKLSIYQADIES